MSGNRVESLADVFLNLDRDSLHRLVLNCQAHSDL